MNTLTPFFRNILVVLLFFNYSVLIAQETLTYESVKGVLDLSVSRFDAGDFKRAIEYGTKGLKQAKEINDDQLILYFQSVLGNSYLEMRDYKEAINYILQIGLKAEQLNNKDVAADAYFALANVYATMGAHNQAAETYKKSADFFKEQQNLQRQVEALTGTAFNFKFSKAYSSSIKYLKQLLTLVKNDPFYTASFNEQLFVIYTEQKDWKNAAKAGEIVYDYKKAEGPKAEFLEIGRQMSLLYSKLGNFNRATDIANEVFNASPSSIESNRVVAVAQIAEGDYQTAITNLNQTLNMVIASPNSRQEMLTYKNLAEAYSESGNQTKALDALKKSEALAMNMDDSNELIEIFELGTIIGSKRSENDLVTRYKNLKANEESNVKAAAANERRTINRADNQAKKYEADLSFKIVNEISKESTNRTAELTDNVKRQQRTLLSTKKELEFNRKENEEIKRLNKELDSLKNLFENQAKVEAIRADGLEEEMDTAVYRMVQAMDEAQLKQQAVESISRLRKSENDAARKQQTIYAIVIGSVVLLLLGAVFFGYKTNQSRKIISGQNRNLEDQQKIINKRNAQLKKSSGHLLKSNNQLKKTQLHLKDSLSKEQHMRSELENINSELKNTQVQLIHAEKMSSLGQLTAGIAHEINNPINFVLNSANIIGMNFEEIKEIMDEVVSKEDGDQIVDFMNTIDIEELKESMDIILEMLGNLKYGADRVTEIVKGLRTFSRFDEAEIKTVDIHENIESSLLILHNKYSDQNITINKNFDTNLPEIECYPGQLNQVFVNIINNAIDVLSEKENPVIEIGTKYESDQAIISIADNGSGISEEIKEKIFDPFFTTKDVGKGTGLGLSISHSIIQQHNGEIKVDSILGEGTKFTIVLPKSLYSVKSDEQAVASN